MSNAITILIADDNTYMRETLRFLITHEKSFTLLAEACSGLEAIRLSKEFNPQIILLDINMAPINGFEATRKIIRQNPEAKIIGLSVHKQPSYARNILSLGAKAYITKSSPHKEILHAIKVVAEGGEYICDELKDLL